MKVLYATDLHGQIGKFECLKKIIDDHDLLIIGADLLPKGPGTTIEKIAHFIDDYLPSYFEYFDENYPDLQIIIDFGNDDRIMYYDMFKTVISRFDNVHRSHENVIYLRTWRFCGMHCVPDYPFDIKDWVREDGDTVVYPRQNGNPFHTNKGFSEKIDDLQAFILNRPSMYSELSNMPDPDDRTVYLIHAPPYASGLDKCFNASLTKTAKPGPVGSKDVREWIEREQPFLTLHGHIHESYEMTKMAIMDIDDTICINPGQKGGGRGIEKTFVWCEFDLNDINGTFVRREMRE